jgi:telomere length regulation protein
MLLLALSKVSTNHLKDISGSPIYNDGLSNRLSASIDRVRFLGMIVGEAISRKIDAEERRLKFKVQDTEDPSAESWRSLIDVDDELYPLQNLQDGIVVENEDISPSPKESTTPAEEFLVEEDDDADKDLQSYPLPESDHEDSDEDPTLVTRTKTHAPL